MLLLIQGTVIQVVTNRPLWKVLGDHTYNACCKPNEGN